MRMIDNDEVGLKNSQNIPKNTGSVNDSKSYGCTQSALNNHNIKITPSAHRLSQLSLFLNE